MQQAAKARRSASTERRAALTWTASQMPFEIPQEIRERTTECERKFSCLTAERTDLCKVTDCASGKVFFADVTTGDRYCPYVQCFGGGHLCTCPTRQGIYHRYRV